MNTIAQTLHTFKDGSEFFAATVTADGLKLAKTRSEDDAAEGYYGQLITVIGLQDAIKLAEAILAARQVDEDAALDAHLEKEWERRQDHMAEQDRRGESF
jgi:RNA binding exosome subunit